jgi:hypothetical protein
VRAYGTVALICRPRNEPLNIVVRQKRCIATNEQDQNLFEKAMTIKSIGRACLKFLALLSIPFLVGFLSYKLAELVPGNVEVVHWQFFVSLTFLICGSLAIIQIWKDKTNLIQKLCYSVLSVVLFSYLALMASARFNCGDESKYIEKSNIKVASVSCG